MMFVLLESRSSWRYGKNAFCCLEGLNFSVVGEFSKDLVIGDSRSCLELCDVLEIDVSHFSLDYGVDGFAPLYLQAVWQSFNDLLHAVGIF